MIRTAAPRSDHPWRARAQIGSEPTVLASCRSAESQYRLGPARTGRPPGTPRHGYQIVERNWRSRIGEIDLVCSRDDVLVFCEVKSRRTDRLGAPAEAVTVSKQLRLRRLAAAYLQAHRGPLRPDPFRRGRPLWVETSPSLKVRFESGDA
jgi:hypothetical protein